MLWRSAPLDIMTRSNAPITAILALAALSLSPAALLAKPQAHKTATASPSATKKRSHKPANSHATESSPATRNKHTSKRRNHHPQQETADLPIINRAHIPAINRGSTLSPAGTTRRKATSADFLRAAGQSEPQETKPDVADSSEAGEDIQPTATQVPTRPSAATPTSVVSVARASTTERPQLESVEEAAATPVILPTLYNKRGHLMVPAPLKGSREILLRQNQIADHDGLDRIRDDDDLLDMRAKNLLVAIPSSSALEVDERLPANRRYCRPWTAQFLATMARAYYARFHTPLQVNSAVRTVEFQQRLLHTNGNAAPAEGETASPHLTGQAIDIAKHGLSLTEIAWMRGYLLPLVQQGKVDVEEEFQQSCFHISVYKKYLPSSAAPSRSIAATYGSRTSALASAIR
jgi:Family of unknown function (DUF5715)